MAPTRGGEINKVTELKRKTTTTLLFTLKMGRGDYNLIYALIITLNFDEDRYNFFQN